MSLYRETSAANAGTACICDLRSDTVTRPDPAMRAAMAEAEVGDDVYGEDPTVTRLEAMLAQQLGKEAGVFFPTGTQSNLAALMAHCGRGDEIIVGDRYHIYCYEAAGASVLAGISLCPVPVGADCAVGAEDVAAAIKADDQHYAKSRLLCLENTVNGQAIPSAVIKTAADVARDRCLAVHLDGARLFNATAALGDEATEFAALVDSVSVCLSKGLGAPAGSVLVGSGELVSRARRHRKILGGSMRQSGILAAAGLYALRHNVPALLDDHGRAARLGKALSVMWPGAVYQATNMVFFTPLPEEHVALIDHMAANGVRIGSQLPTIRMVLHRDVSDGLLDHTIAAFQDFYERI